MWGKLCRPMAAARVTVLDLVSLVLRSASRWSMTRGLAFDGFLFECRRQWNRAGHEPRVIDSVPDQSQTGMN